MTDHKRVYGNYTEYDGDDGYTTLTLNHTQEPAPWTSETSAPANSNVTTNAG